MSLTEVSSLVATTEFVPFDPDAAAEAAGVGVSAWMGFGRLLGLYARVAGRGAIGLHLELERPSNERLRRVVLAHELGHHFTCTGIYVKPFACGPDSLTTSRVEAQAARWAAMHLCPPALVRAFVRCNEAIGAEQVSDIADLVRVPEGFAAWWLADLAARGVVDGAHPSHVTAWVPYLSSDTD